MTTTPDLELTQLPELTLVGFARRVPTPQPDGPNEIPAFWEEFFREGLRDQLPESVIPDLLLGVCWDEQADGTFQYMIGVPARAELPTPAGQLRLDLPARRYARVTAKGEMSRAIPATFRWLEEQGLAEHGLVAAPGACLEWYDQRAGAGAEAEVDLFVPVT